MADCDVKAMNLSEGNMADAVPLRVATILLGSRKIQGFRGGKAASTPEVRYRSRWSDVYLLQLERVRASCSSGRSLRASQASAKDIHCRFRLAFSGQSTSSLMTVAS